MRKRVWGGLVALPITLKYYRVLLENPKARPSSQREHRQGGNDRNDLSCGPGHGYQALVLAFGSMDVPFLDLAVP